MIYESEGFYRCRRIRFYKDILNLIWRVVGIFIVHKLTIDIFSIFVNAFLREEFSGAKYKKILKRSFKSSRI